MAPELVRPTPTVIGRKGSGEERETPGEREKGDRERETVALIESRSCRLGAVRFAEGWAGFCLVFYTVYYN